MALKFFAKIQKKSQFAELVARNRKIFVFLQPEMYCSAAMSEGRFCYDYARAALTADCVVFGRQGAEVFLLLVRRGRPPFAGCWALPGGFMNMDETLERCARRELEEETGLRLTQPLVEVGSFSAVDRDPRGRTVTVAYAAVVPIAAVQAGDDASEARWKRLAARDPDDPLFPIGLELAFDHNAIVRRAYEKLFLPDNKI